MIPRRLHRLHIAALETTDHVARHHIMEEIDTYVVPCSMLKKWKSASVGHGSAALPPTPLRVALTCLCKDPTHTIQLHNTDTRTCEPVSIPIESFFLIPRDTLSYANLPDLGIFIRGKNPTPPTLLGLLHKVDTNHLSTPATMTKRFFTSTVIAQNTRIRNVFTSGNKKGTRKKKILRDTIEPARHWTEIIAKSWCTSMLQETIPCLERYKRGFKHSHTIDSVHITEVRACVSLMYGTLLKLYPRGSKVPIFSARVNIVHRIRELLEQNIEQHMEFVKSHASLLKLCLMEYCYNVFPDFFSVEYSFISSHPCMAMYLVTAK
jgi:hypothetical protein